MNNNLLAKELQDWFDNNLKNKSKWSDNIVGETIKNNLIKLNKWKNAPRGNPAKGYQAGIEKKKIKELEW